MSSVVHLYLSSTSLWVNPRDTPRTGNPREPRRNGTVLVSPFFPRGEGQVSFQNDFAGPLGHMPTGFVRSSATGKVKTALPGTMADVGK